MQRQGHVLCGRVGWAVHQLLGPHRTRSLQTASRALSEHEGLALGMKPCPSAVDATHLHSVVSAQEGPNSFAVATVTFAAPAGAEAGAAFTASSAQHAAQVALLAIRGALGCQRPPSAVLALPSLELPRPAVQALAEALQGQLGPGTPLLGCSSRLRLPDEQRAVAPPPPPPPPLGAASAAADTGAAAEGGAAAAVAPWSAAAVVGDPPPRGPLFHVTLAAAHLPDHEAVAVRCETSSLPSLPYLTEALQGRRPPAFLLLAGADSLAAELLARLENLFPGSCIGSGVAAQQLGRDRRLMLVGPGGAGGGGGSSSSRAAAGGGGGAGPSGRSAGAVQAAAQAVTAAAGGGRHEVYDLERGGGGDAALGMSPSSSPSSTSPSSTSPSSTSPSSTSPSSEFEGHFQRMLLDRNGSATASSSNIDNNSGGGRRRRHPGTAAGRKPGGDEPPSASQAAAAVGRGDDDDDATEAEAAVAAVLNEIQPPYVIIGDQVYGGGGGGGGGALLAVYPKEAASPVAAAASAAAGGRRLPAASCDVLARLALGTDHMHHVALVGSALSAISPPPTGPEPATAFPPAPDNPFYWWPAAVQLPDLTAHTEPHLPQPTSSSKDTPNPDPDMLQVPVPEPSGRQRQAPSSPAAVTATAREGGDLGSRREGQEVYVEGGGGGNDDDDEDAAAAALAALGSDLTGLPLFPLQGVILFPGQTIQLRLFEKRYRLLARSCLQQGAAFGLCWRGMGTTAVVRSYQSAQEGGSGEVMVLLEGGVRFSYGAEELTVLPASYGINAATRAEYVVDEPPAREYDVAALLAAARSVLEGISGALEEAAAPSVQHAARSFANALHFASSSSSSSQQQPSSSSASSTTNTSSTQQQQLQQQGLRRQSSPAVAAPPDPASSLAAATSAAVAATAAGTRVAAATAAAAAATSSAFPSSSALAHPQQPQQPQQQQHGDQQQQQQQSPDDSSSSSSAAALLAADLDEAKRVMDVETASLLSLYLAPHIPVHLESLRREWFTSRSALWRLQQEAAWLKSSPRVCMAAASSVLRLPREHPLRIILGLSRVATVGG